MKDDDKNYLEIRNQQVKETKNVVNEVLDSMIDSAAESSIKPVFHTIGTGFAAGLGLIGTTLAYLNQEYITAATIASIGCYHAVKCDNYLQTAKNYFQAMKYLGDQKVGINHLIDEFATKGIEVTPENVFLEVDEEHGVKLIVEKMPEELLDEDGNLDMEKWNEASNKPADDLDEDPSMRDQDNDQKSNNDNDNPFDDWQKLNNLIHNRMIKNLYEDEDEFENSRSDDKGNEQKSDNKDNDQKSDDKDNLDHDHNDKSDNDMER